MRRLPAFLMGCLLLAATLVQARAPKGFDPDRDVELRFRNGAVVATVPPGAHLKAAFMAVTLKPGTPGTLKAGPLPPTRDKDELGDGVWHGQVVIPVAGSGLKGTVGLVVEYQPCTEGQGGVCFAPTERTLEVPASAIPVLGAAGPKAPAAAAAPAGPAVQPAPAAEPVVVAAPPVPPAPAPAGSGLLLVFLSVFSAGLLASLTPCVYPMIPITMAIIGAKGGGKARGFALSLVLVLGIAVTYTALGVIAARAGAAAGAFAQSRAFLFPLAVLFGLFALSLFGAFEIRLPGVLQQRLQGGGPRKGYAGAFIMGLVLGPISAPCVGPIIGTVLLAIAQKGQVLLGAAELFTFALGMGVLFVVVGTLSAALPRSGAWLERLKKLMGLVVLAFAVWTLRLVVPDWCNFGLWSLVLLVAAPVLGAYQPAETLPAGLGKGLGLAALSLGILLGIRGIEARHHLELLPAGGSSAPAPAGDPGWIRQDLEGALAQAHAGGKVVLVDIYAEWCGDCKELDEKTWPDPKVAAWIRDHAVAVRIDTDKVRKDLGQRLGVRSYPTVLVLDAQGRELRRSLGFQPPRDMLRFLNG